ncbi:hypothetical protein [Acidovorax sp. MR-S7]|uniref:hypothetical protein n=1 Tax=Acidovorax sp. MR-S7 TaxID=1268622 RepID=UPI00037E53F4|nr:hypothetical protein [Acidovorax sp. MR-S7]GAD20974.1 hypothetical protein AVS7_00735 [Acidovorax sp. MR-S7]
MNIIKLLTIAGVPVTLHAQAIECIEEADDRSDGLLWAKLRTRTFRAGKIADALDWEHDRLIQARPDWADDDIAPMLNITANGDNGPWEFPGGKVESGRPIGHFWTEPDDVQHCYWAPGHHPRSHAARKAWYRRNGGEFRAWRLGMPIDPANMYQRWHGSEGRLSVTVYRSGDAWLLLTTRQILGKLHIKTRKGFEVDNVFSGPVTPQMWFPIPGYELRAPVTWSVLPQWGAPTQPAQAGFFTPGGAA